MSSVKKAMLQPCHSTAVSSTAPVTINPLGLLSKSNSEDGSFVSDGGDANRAASFEVGSNLMCVLYQIKPAPMQPASLGERSYCHTCRRTRAARQIRERR